MLSNKINLSVILDISVNSVSLMIMIKHLVLAFFGNKVEF